MMQEQHQHAGPADQAIMATLFDPLVIRAREQAREDFTGWMRKTPPGREHEALVYFSHLQRVAVTLAEAGYPPHVVCAGYLHDHIEDLPDWNRGRMAQQFGEPVATLVDWVTQQDKSLSWEVRNQRYFERLCDAPGEALAISAADKISNIEGLLVYLRQEIPVRNILKRGWEANSQKFHELLALFRGRIPDRLVQVFEEQLNEFDRLGAPLEQI